MIDWQKGFPIGTICRADLKNLGFTEEQIALLSDKEMELLAATMEYMYCDDDFWDDLTAVTRLLLHAKEETTHGNV